MRSVMGSQFSNVPSTSIQRSRFKRNNGLKTAFFAGDLIPIYWDEVLPGDTHTVRFNGFGRMATPIHPVFDNMFLDTFFFFVPNRLLWDNWEKFCGYQENPGDSTDFLVPTMTSPATTGYAENSLSDYFGIPTNVGGLTHISLYHRGYNKIWDDWFRDQNIQDQPFISTADTQDDPANYPIRKRGKRHDYFTSCLPWPQKDNGNPVLLPLGQSARIVTDANVGQQVAVYNNSIPGTRNIDIVASEAVYGSTDVSSANEIYADLSTATAATINDLRQAFQVQRMFEKDARGGTRYVEVLKNHFQVVSPDFRLQRSEYLGGGSSMVNIHPVAQTTPTGVVQDVTPQGNLAAFGTVSPSGHGFTKSFVEHGIIIGLASIRADLTYQQGLDRHFSRQTRFDYFWPSLANLGEMAVLNKEIYAQGDVDPAADDAVFGYQEHWAEYRYKPSRITSAFRSNAAEPLDSWHLSLDFANLPVLTSPAFIEDDPPVERVIAVPTEPHFILDAFFNVTSARPMPINSVPGLIDHF